MRLYAGNDRRHKACVARVAFSMGKRRLRAARCDDPVCFGRRDRAIAMDAFSGGICRAMAWAAPGARGNQGSA